MGRQWRLTFLFFLLVLYFSVPQEAMEKLPSSTSYPPIPKEIKVERWQQQLGEKVQALRETIPTARAVILVPDAPTFLQVIQSWNFERRYPILIEDDHYTALFINQFQPQEVIRLSSINQPFLIDRKTAMKKAVAAAWETEEKSLKKTWKEVGWEPPGVVITSVYDPAWVAAVALAADRGQPLLFLEGDFGEVNQTLAPRGWQHLKKEVNYLVESTGYEYKNLGDTIDTITLVRTLPVKYRHPKTREVLAVTDGLGRHENEKRYAIAGWIYGSPEKSLYQAMCAIFLNPKTTLLYDSYPKTPPWKNYHFDGSKQWLEERGFKVKKIESPQASQETWKDLISQPWDYHLAFINSRGGQDNFFVGEGNATVEDIPNLNTPVIIHMIHSFSAANPDNINTVAGRWLSEGAYVYVGSIDEPYVTGFVPPKFIISRLLLNVPFLVSCRYEETPPWKITTIGDPLMLVY